MGLPGRSHKGYLQFGREGGYGTPVTATHRIPYVSCVTNPVGGTLKSEMMNGNRWRHGIYQGPVLYRTTVVVEMWYAGMLLLIDALMGTAAFGSNGGTTTGANPYAHTYDGGDLINSNTLQIIEGDVPAGKCQRLAGAKIDTAVLSGAAGAGSGGICTLTLGILSQLYSPDITPTSSLSAVAAQPVLFHELVADDGSGDAGSDQILKSFEVSINNHLAERQHSSISIAEPVCENFADIVIKMTKEFQSKTLLNGFNSFTSFSPSLIFGTVNTKRMTLSITGTAKITEYSHPITGAGIIMQNVTWESYRPNSVAGPLRWLVENQQATILT